MKNKKLSNIWNLLDEYSEEQMEELEASVTLDDYGRNKFDVDDNE